MRKTVRTVAAALALFACAAFAEEVGETQARTVAMNFISKDAAGRAVLPGRSVRAVTRRGGLWLVALEPGGHVFVSANRSAEPIPAFSEHDFAEPQPGSSDAALLADAEARSRAATGAAHEARWRTLLGAGALRMTVSGAAEPVSIAPLLTTTWDQGYPYNELAPVINGAHTPVGCVATAYAQIMRYWGWPERLNEDVVTEHSVDAMWGHKWRLKAGTVFDWQDMPDSYRNDSATRLKLARAAMFAGMLARMSYKKSASSAQAGQPGKNGWYAAHRPFGDFNSTLDERKEAMKASLRNGCPFMVGVNTSDGAHAVVGDGWQESADGTAYLHMNYGWQDSNTRYYNPSEALDVFLDAKPRPMVMNKPLATRSALPVTVAWSFPPKGYADTLAGFEVTYVEVEGSAADWSDDMTDPTGALSGGEMQFEEIAACGAGRVLRIGTEADGETCTWPTFVATADTALSYDVRSYNALGMVVEVQLLDPSVGWIALDRPALGAKTVVDWTTRRFDLGEYAGKGIAVRVKATRDGSTSYKDDEVRETGVQIDNVRLTQVRRPKAGVAGKTTAGAAARSAAVNDPALVAGRTYLFQVAPTFSDATQGVPGYAASCTIVAAGDAKPTITSVASVVATAPAVTDGTSRDCYFGLNQFGVYGSEAMTGLEAHLSCSSVIGEVREKDATQPGTYITTHNKVSIADAVTVEKKADGKFLVRVDMSPLTTYLNNTQMILTLVGRNAQGDAEQKDVCLNFVRSGGETRIAVEDLPESGGTVTPAEPEPVYYDVRFESAGGSAVAARRVKAGEAVGTLDVPTRSGFTFVGWFTAATGGTQVTASTPVSASVTYYAQWDEDAPTGGDDPAVDPSAGNPNDFTDGGANYRFCNGVDRTGGFSDVHRSGTYNTLPPIAYNLIYWWVGRYKAAFGDNPGDYVAPSESAMATQDSGLSIAGYTATLLGAALKTTLPAGTEREKYFPADNVAAADWQGASPTADKAVQVGRRIFAALAKGPIGFKAHTSSTKFYCGVIWGCEYASDAGGKYATKLWVTDTRSKGDGIKAFAFTNCSNTYGALPGLKDFNGSGTSGVIEYYYPIVGPAKDAGGDPDEPPDEPPPEDPDEPEDDAIGVADNAGDPGKDYSATYGYEMYDNYWTARKRAIQQRKQLFILSGAAWCSNCSFVKGYLAELGTRFTDRFVAYFSDHDDDTVSPYFHGGLPQYGAADPRTADAFTGTLDGGKRTWDSVWTTAGSGVYAQDRGGYAPARVDAVVNAGIGRGATGAPTNLVIRGLSTLAAGYAGRYELYAQFDDGVEMPVDRGVTWTVVSGNGRIADASVDGRAVAALTVASGAVTIRATSTFYFTGSKSMTVASADLANVESVAIRTESLNLEDDATPLIDAVATMRDGSTVPVVGFGNWSASFVSRIARKDPDLEEANVTPVITFDGESRLNYAKTNGRLEVCDQRIAVALEVNGRRCEKEITVWGPTKVAPSKWKMVSGPRQTLHGVVRLQCTELKYNYGGEIRTTTDTYFASYRTVLKYASGATQDSYLRGLTVFSISGKDEVCAVGLAATKANGKFSGYTPASPTESALATNFTNVATGGYVTGIERGEVPSGFFKAFFKDADPTTYPALADADSDGDGFRNWEEYVLGTDPTDAADGLTLMQGYQHLTAPAANGETMQYKVMYQQRAYRTYYIDAKAEWGDAWRHVATMDVGSMVEKDVTTFGDLDADYADRAKFFRVRAAMESHLFNYPATAPVIAPAMLVAAPGSVIDLSDGSALDLVSFDTDATDAGTVWVKVAADAAPGKTLIVAPKTAAASLKACKPKDRADVTFAVTEEGGRMALRIAGVEGQGAVRVVGDEVVVSPKDGVTDITVADLGSRKVVVPSGVDRIVGVGDSAQIVVRSGGHDVTEAMKFTPDGGGFRIELDGGAKFGKDEIPVRPVLSGMGDVPPLTVTDDALTLGVKTIPGLKYQAMRYASLGGDPEPVGEAKMAEGTRLTLEVKRTSDPSGFYAIRVSK